MREAVRVGPSHHRSPWVKAALLMLTVLLAGCGAAPAASRAPAASTKPKATGGSSSSSSASASSFAAKWNALIAQAKKEGEVDIVAGGGASRLFRPVVAAFQKKFGIRVIMTTGSSSQQASRVLAERSKGVYSVDIAMTGANTSASRYIPNHALDPVLKWLIRPGILNKSNWYGGHFWWGDREHEYNFIYSAIVSSPPTNVEYNTNKVKPSELNAMQDLLNPKFQGKIGAIPPTVPGSQESYYEMYVDPQVGPQWVKHFIQNMHVFYSTNYRLLENRLAQGSIWMCVMCGSVSHDVNKMHKQGLPVKQLSRAFKENGVLVAAGSEANIGVFNHPAHPAATRLFVNWFLSKAGQTAMETLSAAPPRQSLRLGVPPGKTLPAWRRKAGVHYGFYSADPATLKERPQAVAAAVKWYDAILAKG